MTSTQSSEGMNSIVKMKIKSYYTLLDFVGNFECVLKSIREKENCLDHEDRFGSLSMFTILGIEKSVVGVYINQVFFEFQ